MADIYQTTIADLAWDPKTYFPKLPADIVGIIQKMQPQSYSFGYIEELLVKSIEAHDHDRNGYGRNHRSALEFDPCRF